MSGESWKKMGVIYKDSKQPDIEEPREKHLKKKQKKNNRSKHKHKYIPAIYHLTYFNLNSDKKQKHVTCGSHCQICGRVKNMRFIWTQEQEQIEKFKKEHPNYVEIKLPDGWDYFKDKNIPVNNDKLGYAFS